MQLAQMQCEWVTLVFATAASLCFLTLTVPLTSHHALIQAYVTDRSDLLARGWFQSDLLYVTITCCVKIEEVACCNVTAGVSVRKWFEVIIKPWRSLLFNLCVAGRKSRGLHWPHQLHDRQSHRVQEETVSPPLRFCIDLKLWSNWNRTILGHSLWWTVHGVAALYLHLFSHHLSTPNIP